MIKIKIPSKGILIGRSALIYYGFLDKDNNKTSISMPRGTNTTSYKIKYSVTTQRKETMWIGTSVENGIRMYRIERLFIELEKIGLSDEELKKVLVSLEKEVNISILKDISKKLRGNVKGVDWKRVNDFLSKDNSLKTKAINLHSIRNSMFKEQIYSASKIEIPTLTFLDTEKVLENLPTNNLKPKQIETIISLKKAFELLVSDSNSFSLGFMKNINYEVAKGEIHNAGELRSTIVTIGGSSYIPQIYSEDDIVNFFNEINRIENPRVRAATYLVRATRMQIFNNGNKRTSIIGANKILQDSAAGILSIHENQLEKYFNLLSSYYLDESIEREFILFILKNIYSTHEEKIMKLNL